MARPEIKVYFKSAEQGGGFADLCAFWRNDRGMLSGRLDRRVRAIKIEREDGSEVVLKPDEKGVVSGWYLNARTEDAGAATRAPRSRPSAGSQRSGPIDDMPDDDLPF